ncbi:MAG: hypothetical protein KAU17_08485 [Spirochaetales bacterium]|nr:hypothetical protein [Spirochaetales bacterium]
MDSRPKETHNLYAELQPVTKGLGFEIVEIARQQRRGILEVHIVIHQETGVTISDCVEVSKTLRPRVELVEDTREINLEISSPGLSRKLKYLDEFDIFTGRLVKVFLADSQEWIMGKILHGGTTITLEADGNTMRIEGSNIQKAKLAYSQEVRK